MFATLARPHRRPTHALLGTDVLEDRTVPTTGPAVPPDMGVIAYQTEVPVRIPLSGTVGTVTSDLVVADGFAIKDLDVWLDITHTFDSDLTVTLFAPDGTEVELFRGVGGSGDNFQGTVLDDEAAASIGSGSAPFAGRFRPAPGASLAAFDGRSAAGTWTLRIVDSFTDDSGILNGWGLLVTPDRTGVDLFGRGLAVDTDEVEWGGGFTLDYDIGNLGVLPAGPLVARFVLTDPSGFAADVPLADVAVPGVAAGGQVTGSVTLTLPPAPPPGFPAAGPARVAMVLDPDRTTGDQFPVNNRGRGLGLDSVAIYAGDFADVRDAAEHVPLTGSIRGSISRPGDVDFVRFDVPFPGGYLTGSAAARGGSLDPRLVLVNVDSLLERNGVPLGSGGPLAGSDDRAPRDTRPLVRQYLLPGRYWVAVSSGATGPTATGGYTLDLAFEPNAADPYDLTRLPVRTVVGDNPVVLLSRDLNGDRILDLITANRDSADVSVLIGNGDGTFRPQVRYAVGLRPDGLDLIDFNSDGRLDVVVVNTASRRAVFVPGLGDGTFDTGRTTELALPGTDPVGIATGDFNGDPFADLAVANRGSSDVTIFLGRENGAFGPAVTVPVPFTPTRVAAQEVTNDGRIDVIAIDETSGTTAVLPGDGSGRFDPSAVFQVPFNLFDNSTRTFELTVPDAFVLSNATVSLTIDHAYTSDLTVTLIAPDGTRVLLFAGVGGSGDYFLNTRLDDAAPTSITTASAPFLGRFRPAQALAGLAGKSAQGVWRLEIVDDFRGDAGTLQRWSLGLTPVGQTTAREYAREEAFVGIGFDISGTRVRGDFNRDGVSDNADLVPRLDGSGQFENAISLATGSEVANGTVVVTTRSNYPVEFAILAQSLGSSDAVSIPVNVFINDNIPISADRNYPNPPRSTPQFVDVTGDGTADSVLVSRSGDILVRPGRADLAGTFDPPILVNADGSGARDAIVLTTGPGARVAALDLLSDTFAVYGRRADGVWVVQGRYPTGQLALRLATADLNADGLPDVVTGDALTGTVSVLLGQSDGQFVAQSTVRLGVTVSEVVVRDVNGDGQPDIVASDLGGGNVQVLLNLGRTPSGGVVIAPPVFYRGGVTTFGVIEAISNVANPIIDDVFQSRFGLILPELPFPEQYFTISDLELSGAVVADLTGDGLPEIITVNRGAGTLGILANLGGRFVDPVSFTIGGSPTTATAADVDGDGDMDLLVLDESAGTVRVLLNDGAGGLALSSLVPVGNRPNGLSTRDFDGGGVIDLAVGNEFGDLLLLRGRGNGEFDPYRRAATGVPLAVADLDGDGRRDVVLVDQAGDRVSVQFRAEDSTAFAEVFADDRTNPDLLAPGAVVLAFLDGPNDAFPDMVIASTGGNNVLVYRGTGVGEFAAPVSYFAGTNPAGLTTADVNGDGVLDVIVANRGSNDVSILFGTLSMPTPTAPAVASLSASPAGPTALDSGPVWSASLGPRLASGGRGPVGVIAADQTGDGLVDLVVTNAGDGMISLLRGVGGGFFNDSAPPRASLGGPLVGPIVPEVPVPVPGPNGTPSSVPIRAFVPRVDGTVVAIDMTPNGPANPRPVFVGGNVLAVRPVTFGGTTALVTANTTGQVSLLQSGATGQFTQTGIFSGNGFGVFQPSDLSVVAVNGRLEAYVSGVGRSQPAVFDFSPAAPGEFGGTPTIPGSVLDPQISSLPPLTPFPPPAGGPGGGGAGGGGAGGGGGLFDPDPLIPVSNVLGNSVVSNVSGIDNAPLAAIAELGTRADILGSRVDLQVVSRDDGTVFDDRGLFDGALADNSFPADAGNSGDSEFSQAVTRALAELLIGLIASGVKPEETEEPEDDDFVELWDFVAGASEILDRLSRARGAEDSKDSPADVEPDDPSADISDQTHTDAGPDNEDDNDICGPSGVLGQAVIGLPHAMSTAVPVIVELPTHSCDQGWYQSDTYTDHLTNDLVDSFELMDLTEWAHAVSIAVLVLCTNSTFRPRHRTGRCREEITMLSVPV